MERDEELCWYGNASIIEDETERVETHQIVMRGIDELSSIHGWPIHLTCT